MRKEEEWYDEKLIYINCGADFCIVDTLDLFRFEEAQMWNRRSPRPVCCCPLCCVINCLASCFVTLSNWMNTKFNHGYRQSPMDEESIISSPADLIVGFSRLRDDNTNLNKWLREKEDELLQADNKNAVLSDQLKRANENIRKLKQENEDLKNRLSEFMGNKLRENNPAITNLNDPNRPMKLADRFSELYENEWTDAFSDLTDSGTLSDIDATTTLVNILKEIHHLCKEEVTKKWSELKTNSKAETSLSKLKESLKRSATEYIPSLTKKIMENKDSNDSGVFRYKDTCFQYIRNCIKICYYAELQDPPVHINFDAEPGKPFDKQCFKEYTKSGTYVDYLVWPALYLHKDGPLMAKGVVQPK